MSVSIMANRVGATGGLGKLALVHIFALAVRSLVDLFVARLAHTLISALSVDALGSVSANVSVLTFVHV